MDEKNVNEEYGAMRTAVSSRQLKWIAAYNKDPELAAVVVDLFELPEEDIRFMIRMINSMKDGLYFYKESNKPKKTTKKKTTHTIAAVV